MAAKKQMVDASKHGQTAYTTRNRTSLIKAAQEVLAEVGITATIDQLASRAHVSPQTIYNYFESKENLLAEALEDVWREWVIWAYNGVTPGSSLQAMLDVCRKLFRVKETHPQFARILKNTLVNPTFVINVVNSMALSDFLDATAKDGFANDQFEERVYLWSYSLAGILSAIYVTEVLSPETADKSLELSLQTLDISKAKAKKLVSHPLEYPEPKMA